MFTLKINNTSNAAFEESVSQEVADILESIADRVRNGATSGKCMDSWGNSVGSWELKDEDEE